MSNDFQYMLSDNFLIIFSFQYFVQLPTSMAMDFTFQFEWLKKLSSNKRIQFSTNISKLIAQFEVRYDDFKKIFASIVDKHALTFVVSEKHAVDQLVHPGVPELPRERVR